MSAPLNHAKGFTRIDTRRITPMARPADGRRLNRPLAAFWLAYLAIYFGFIAWSLS